MGKIKKILVVSILVLFSVFTIEVSAATSIKENSDDFTGDVYIIGGTKFHNNFAITAPRAIKAGMNQSDLLSMWGTNFDPEFSKKLFYFSELTGKWYEIPETGGKVKPVTREEKRILEDELNIFYVNNEEKILEFTPGVPVEGTIHEDYGVKYKNGKFKVPATTTYFAFNTTNGNMISVDTSFDYEDEELNFGDFYFPKSVYVYDYNDKDNVNAVSRNYFSTTKEGKIEVYSEDELYYSDDEYAVDGYVDKDGNPIDILSMTFTEDTTVYQKLSKAAISVCSRKYSIDKISEAIESSNINYGCSATLIKTDDKKTVVSKLITLDKENVEMTLDLNGQTLSRDTGGFVIYAIGKNSILNVSNGILENKPVDNKPTQAITVGQGTTTDQNISVMISNNVIINTESIGIAVMGKGANLNFSGKINLLKEGASGISGNGLADSAGTNIYVNNASIVSEKDNTYGLYLPQEGTTTINTTYINTATAIGIKAGQLNIESSNLNAYGIKNTPSLNNNGVNSTGDAIYVEMNEKYLDNININIDESTGISSTNGKAIMVYNPDNMDEPTINAGNYRTVEVDGNKTYYTYTGEGVISVGNKLYKAKDIARAIKESSKEHPATIVEGLGIITVSEDIIVDNIGIDVDNPDELYLDLNGNTIRGTADCYGALWLQGENTTLTVSNGYLEAEGSASAIISGQKTTEEQNVRLIIEEDVYISAPNYGVNVFGEKAALDFNGSISISEDGYGISGTNPWGKTEINIYDKANISATQKNSFALYLPQPGVTNIYGGTLTGASVIGIKLGELNILGGTFEAIGDKILPVYPTNNGTESTGDVIFVEMNNNYFSKVSEEDRKIVINVSEDASLGSLSAQGAPIFVYNSNSEIVPTINAPQLGDVSKTTDVNGKPYTYYRYGQLSE